MGAEEIIELTDDDIIISVDIFDGITDDLDKDLLNLLLVASGSLATDDIGPRAEDMDLKVHLV